MESMATLKDRLVDLMPDRFKAALRPLYLRTMGWFSKPTIDQPSALGLGAHGGFEVAYRKRTSDEAILKHSFAHDKFFPAVPGYQPGAGDVILDVGAHIGTFALLASQKVPAGRVFAIEASQDSFNLLRINVALNGIENVSCHHLALSDRDGTCRLFHDRGNWGHSVVKALSRSSESVRCLSLASFFNAQGIKACHFMKLNCEGSEFPILMSADRDTLNAIGTLVVLYHTDLWTSHNEADLVAHLQANGFHCSIRNRFEYSGWIIARNGWALGDLAQGQRASG